MKSHVPSARISMDIHSDSTTEIEDPELNVVHNGKLLRPVSRLVL